MHKHASVIALLAAMGLSCAGQLTESRQGETPVGGPERRSPIRITDIDEVRANRPLLIAHRGGVITPDSPECSLAAIRLAAGHGYHMVELDVQETSDGEPVLFHDYGLSIACGVRSRICELTCKQATAIKYRASDQRIATLDEALALCRSLGLGVMLDIKVFGDPPNSEAFFQRIGQLLDEHGLTQSTVTFTRHPLVEKHLAGRAMFVVTREEVERVEQGEAVDLTGRFVFELPYRLPSDTVPKLQRNGAIVIPPINTFLYPAHAHRELAHQDIKRLLAAGVDGLQIDSVYEDLVVKEQ